MAYTRYGEAKRWLEDHIANPPDTDECIPWPFAKMSRTGHGVCGGRPVSRILLGLEKGDPRHARHTCHNGWCVNRRHLITGTPAENSHDMVLAGRHRCGSSPGAAGLYRRSEADEVEELLNRAIAVLKSRKET